MFDQQPKQVAKWQDIEGGTHDTQREAQDANHDLEFEQYLDSGAADINHMDSNTADYLGYPPTVLLFESPADLREWIRHHQLTIENYLERRGPS
jgi:hypothetical protein